MNIKPSTNPGEVLVRLNEKDEALMSRARDPLVPFKRILVPVDFSDCSKEALRCAVPLARHFGATLLVVHVVQPNYPADPCLVSQYEQFESSLIDSSQGWLEKMVREIVPPEVPSQLVVRTGHPAVEIVRAAAEMRADMIFISTHGYTGIKHVVFGSTAENVVRHSPCPVLTMRASATK
jgi:nucleotide-binding universal stress UspA family protein